MKNITLIIPALLLAGLIFANTAIAQSHGGHGHHQNHAQHEQTESDDVLKATAVDGVQVAEVEVGPMGYSAKRVAFEAGVPARLVFTRVEEGGCTHQVQIPAIGVEATDLPIGESIAFEFMPEEASEFTFACAMDMVSGTVVVAD